MSLDLDPGLRVARVQLPSNPRTNIQALIKMLTIVPNHGYLSMTGKRLQRQKCFNPTPSIYCEAAHSAVLQHFK